MNYYDTFEFVQSVEPTATMPQWETLMYECDREESQG